MGEIQGLLSALGLGGAAHPIRRLHNLGGEMAFPGGGKAESDQILAKFLGHSNFRSYGITNPNRLRSDPIVNDPMTYGGMLSGGHDYGYPNTVDRGFAHKDALDALNALLSGKPPAMNLGQLLYQPYRSVRGLRG